MRRVAYLLVILSAAGCVERKFVVDTDPPNVLVLVNHTPLGPSPAFGSFVYHGTYNFTLMAPGYETLHATECLRPPWYEWPGLDFFFETLWPFELQDVHTFHYHLAPLAIPNTDEVLRRSGMVRGQGQAIRPAPTPPPEPGTQTTVAPPQGEAPPAEMPREGDR